MRDPSDGLRAADALRRLRRKTVEYWLQLADADRADRDAQRRYDDRRVHLSQGYGGTWLLDGELDPIGGGVIAGELARLEDQLFKAEWADAKARLGHDPTAADLERSPRQRRADALLEMATRSASVPADGRRPEPLFTILVGWETFSGRICELANGTVVATGSLVPWLASAWLERIVFTSPTRVTDVGVARRLFKGATRRAVEGQRPLMLPTRLRRHRRTLPSRPHHPPQRRRPHHHRKRPPSCRGTIVRSRWSRHATIIRT